jgi:hypothetical protein
VVQGFVSKISAGEVWQRVYVEVKEAAESITDETGLLAPSAMVDTLGSLFFQLMPNRCVFVCKKRCTSIRNLSLSLDLRNITSHCRFGTSKLLVVCRDDGGTNYGGANAVAHEVSAKATIVSTLSHISSKDENLTSSRSRSRRLRAPRHMLCSPLQHLQPHQINPSDSFCARVFT